jgi:hypothetical protein
MERAKSRTLVELIFSRADPVRWRPSDGLAADRIQALRRQLNWYYRRIEVEQTREEGVSSRQVNELWVEARANEDELLRTIRELPASRQDGFDDPGPAVLEQIRAALRPGTAVLEYFQIADQIVAAVVTRRNTALAEVGSALATASSIRMLDFQLSKFRIKGFDFEEFSEELLAATNHRLEQLYVHLIGPVAAELKECEHVVVVPHGVLHYVPFHALRDGSDYLVDRFTVSYAPSATTYAVCEQKRPKPVGRSLLLGVPDAAAPWIRQEIQSVAAVVPSPQILLGRAATGRKLKSAAPGSRIVHIATHGVFRRDNPMFSRVRLGDSYLTLYDLYHLHLPVELLTLSGCGTGLSVVAAGDELLGLMRGLLCAGAQSLLLTLWDAHDRTTAEFMTVFYGSLAKRLHKGAALREAMRQIRSRYPHPYYWAPFVLVGKVFHDET